MADSLDLQRLATRAAYALTQGPRVAWYMGQGLAMKRLRAVAKSARAPATTSFTLPGERKMRAALIDLFLRDLANVEAGLYPMPRDRDGTLVQQLARARAFFADLPDVHKRREAGHGSEVRDQVPAGRRPAYYLQNFHFQSGGWMSEDSARIYDNQVEVLFNGSANAMRRQILPVLADFMRGRDQRQVHLADLACGTGRFLGQVAQAFPRLNLTGIDLSDAYIAEARQHMRRRARARFLVAKAEELPFADDSVDAISAIFLFHELPPKIRAIVAGEIGRVLKPGGRFFLMDSLQIGDLPEFDGLLDLFPQNFHEPYYAGYVRQDLQKLFAGGGLKPVSAAPVFVSKLNVFEKAA